MRLLRQQVLSTSADGTPTTDSLQSAIRFVAIVGRYRHASKIIVLCRTITKLSISPTPSGRQPHAVFVIGGLVDEGPAIFSVSLIIYGP
jgi:hypothetical protein